MRSWLIDILADPLTGDALRLEPSRTRDGEILEGRLCSDHGFYDVRGGIPRFALTEDADQRQTGDSFGFKWGRTDSYESEPVRETLRQWIVQRYGFSGPAQMQAYFGSRKRILDAGCGSAFASSLYLRPDWNDVSWVGMDISSAIDLAHKRLNGHAFAELVQGDILQPPFRKGSFDTIFSEGVLHHTPSTKRAFQALIPLLCEGGEFLFYVYRKKSPLREFADDHVRAQISNLPPHEAWEALRPLTRLGQALAELRVEVDVPEDVPQLGIPAGRVDIQRLFYWHVAKAFWNPEHSFEENHHVNFDWYHPKYAHRQTEAEVRSWCRESGLEVAWFDRQPSGFTVRAIKKRS